MEERKQQLERLYPTLLGLAAKFVPYETAGDVVHSAAVELLSLPEDKQTTDSWVRDLIVSRALNHIRDEKRKQKTEQGFLDITHGDGQHDPEQTMLFDELLHGLQEALTTLPWEEIEVILLRFGLFGSETERHGPAISRILDVSKSSVNNRIKSAIRKLRRELDAT